MWQKCPYIIFDFKKKYYLSDRLRTAYNMVENARYKIEQGVLFIEGDEIITEGVYGTYPTDPNHWHPLCIDEITYYNFWDFKKKNPKIRYEFSRWSVFPKEYETSPFRHTYSEFELIDLRKPNVIKT